MKCSSYELEHPVCHQERTYFPEPISAGPSRRHRVSPVNRRPPPPPSTTTKAPLHLPAHRQLFQPRPPRLLASSSGANRSIPPVLTTMPRLPVPPPQLTSNHGNRDHRATSPLITTAVPFVPSRTPLASPLVNPLCKPSRSVSPHCCLHARSTGGAPSPARCNGISASCR